MDERVGGGWVIHEVVKYVSSAGRHAYPYVIPWHVTDNHDLARSSVSDHVQSKPEVRIRKSQSNKWRYVLCLKKNVRVQRMSRVNNIIQFRDGSAVFDIDNDVSCTVRKYRFRTKYWKSKRLIVNYSRILSV